MTTTRLTAGPPDAKINPEGFRTYRWPVTNSDGSITERELLSVTSIRKLVGEPYGLVNWQINKIVDRALEREYLTRLTNMLTAEIDSEAIDDDGQEYMESGRIDITPDADDLLRLRKWLRAASTEERDAAATKGLDIHGALELGWEPEQCNEQTRPYIVQTRHALAMHRAVILALEFQCWNLTAGYAGTGDCLLWLLPLGEDRAYWQAEADAKRVTLEIVQRVGGHVELGDFKTGKSMYTDHVTQLHAYLGGEHIGTKGVIDERLTALLRATDKAGILHLKPDSWEWPEVPFNPIVMRAFFGAVAFAQLLAAHKTPNKLFGEIRRGSADG